MTALAAAYLAGTQSLANALKVIDPERAYVLAPWDASVAARYARSRIPLEKDPRRLAVSEAIARRALQRDATMLDAVVTLGFTADIRGDGDRARRYLGASQILSRRDLETQLWAIEDAVRQGDVPGAMSHYDIALRTSREARALLFPVLTSAISDPVIADALTRLVKPQPYWTPDFVFFLAGNASDPRAAAALLARFERGGIAISDTAQAVLIDNLLSKGDVDQAWSFYARYHPGADRRRSRDPQFDSDRDSRSAFDWQMFGDAGIATAIERGADGNVLAFSVPPGGSGLLARQMQVLPPGRYVLRSRSARIDLPPHSRPLWDLSCRDGRPLGRITLSGSGDTPGTTTGAFDVPTGCPVQYLSLIARPSDRGSGSEGEILDIRLGPAS